MVAARLLREAGLERIRIVEKGGDFGGTWYWDRYPGPVRYRKLYLTCRCSGETGYIPQEKYSFAAEIRAHARRIGETFDLYKHALFQTETRRRCAGWRPRSAGWWPPIAAMRSRPATWSCLAAP